MKFGKPIKNFQESSLRLYKGEDFWYVGVNGLSLFLSSLGVMSDVVNVFFFRELVDRRKKRISGLRGWNLYWKNSSLFNARFTETHRKENAICIAWIAPMARFVLPVLFITRIIVPFRWVAFRYPKKNGLRLVNLDFWMLWFLICR